MHKYHNIVEYTIMLHVELKTRSIHFVWNPPKIPSDLKNIKKIWFTFIAYASHSHACLCLNAFLVQNKSTTYALSKQNLKAVYSKEALLLIETIL